MEGIVFDIKRYAIHDGPGIRTTIFIKGCGLNCPWCQNPEGISKKIKLWYFKNKCLNCYRCIDSCPENALSKKETKNDDIVIDIDYDKCNNCGVCVDVCPKDALVFDGKKMTVQQVIEEVMKDKLFYEASGGGLTLSGGDPFVQSEFSLEILKEAKKIGLHTTLDTTLWTSSQNIKKFMKYIDLFLVDLKIWDEDKHKITVEVSNDLIKKNFELLASNQKDIWVRIPLIPGYTAGQENISKISKYVNMINKKYYTDIPIELINYNPLAEEKYERMGQSYRLKDCEPFTSKEIDNFYSILRNNEIKIIEE